MTRAQIDKPPSIHARDVPRAHLGVATGIRTANVKPATTEARGLGCVVGFKSKQWGLKRYIGRRRLLTYLLRIRRAHRSNAVGSATAFVSAVESRVSASRTACRHERGVLIFSRESLEELIVIFSLFAPSGLSDAARVGDGHAARIPRP